MTAFRGEYPSFAYVAIRVVFLTVRCRRGVWRPYAKWIRHPDAERTQPLAGVMIPFGRDAPVSRRENRLQRGNNTDLLSSLLLILVPAPDLFRT